MLAILQAPQPFLISSQRRRKILLINCRRCKTMPGQLLELLKLNFTCNFSFETKGFNFWTKNEVNDHAYSSRYIKLWPIHQTNALLMENGCTQCHDAWASQIFFTIIWLHFLFHNWTIQSFKMLHPILGKLKSYDYHNNFSCAMLDKTHPSNALLFYTNVIW